MLYILLYIFVTLSFYPLVEYHFSQTSLGILVCLFWPILTIFIYIGVILDIFLCIFERRDV